MSASVSLFIKIQPITSCRQNAAHYSILFNAPLLFLLHRKTNNHLQASSAHFRFLFYLIAQIAHDLLSTNRHELIPQMAHDLFSLNRREEQETYGWASSISARHMKSSCIFPTDLNPSSTLTLLTSPSSTGLQCFSLPLLTTPLNFDLGVVYM
jgi:hypothetical protein